MSDPITFAPRLRQRRDGSFVAVRFRQADWVIFGVCRNDERDGLIAEALQRGHPSTFWWRCGAWTAVYIQN